MSFLRIYKHTNINVKLQKLLNYHPLASTPFQITKNVQIAIHWL